MKCQQNRNQLYASLPPHAICGIPKKFKSRQVSSNKPTVELQISTKAAANPTAAMPARHVDQVDKEQQEIQRER